MPIKVDLHDNTSEIKVGTHSNKPIDAGTGSGPAMGRLERLIRQEILDRIAGDAVLQAEIDELVINGGRYLLIDEKEDGSIDISLLNEAREELDKKTIYLTEKLVKSVELDYNNSKVVFTHYDDTILECDVSAITEAIVNEIARATAREDEIAQSVVDETDRATAVEEQLQGNIDALDNRVTEEVATLNDTITQKENELKDLISAEESRATAVEEDLQEQISEFSGDVAQLREDLTRESEVRASADAVLTQTLDDEIARATAKEGELQVAITNEATARQNADNHIYADINAEQERAEEVERFLQTSLYDETQDRIDADDALDAKIDAETTRATTAETALNTRINNLDLATVGETGSYIKTVGQQDGQLSATKQAFDTTLEGATDGNAPTTKTVKDAIDALDLTAVGSDGGYIKVVSQENGQVSATRQSFDTTLTGATNNNAPTTKAVKDAIDALDLAQVGSDGNYIKLVSETDGKVSATKQAFDTDFTSPTNNNAPTTKAVNDRITSVVDDLDLAQVGSDGNYIKYVSQENGQVSATKQAFDTSFTSATNNNAPTTKLVKDNLDAVNTRIDNLDLTAVGSDGGYIKVVSQAEGQVSATRQAFDTDMSDATDNNAPTTKNVKDYVDAETTRATNAEQALTTRINNLDLTQVGSDGSYIKTVKQTDGQLAATKQAFDTTMTSATDTNAPTTKNVKDYVDAETTRATNAETALGTRIDNLDLTSVGSAGSYIKTVAQADGQVSATKQAFDTTLETGASDDNAPTTKAVKSYVDTFGGKIDTITINSVLQPITNKNVEIPTARTDINNQGLSATQKTNIKTNIDLQNVVNTGDSATPVSGGTTKFTTGGAYTELNKKVDKTSAANKVYTTDSSGNQSTITYGTNAVGWTVVERRENGHITLPETPANDTDAASKKYVDAVDTALTTHKNDTSNPHSVTKAQVGLGSVVNTGDSATPTSGGTTKFTTGGAYTLQTNLETKINEDVHIKTSGSEITYDGDDVTKTSTFKNLKTGQTSTKTETIELANSTTAGLMSHTDYNTLLDLADRVSSLEGTAVRITYTDSTTPTAAQIKAAATDYLATRGITNPTDADYSGVSVRVAGTNHLWNYYANTHAYQDDGLDTVTTFTNSIAGIVKGKAADGFVYAESDGTGSVYGWSDLKTRVSNNESDISDLYATKVTKDVNNLTYYTKTSDLPVLELQSESSAATGRLKYIEDFTYTSASSSGTDTFVKTINGGSGSFTPTTKYLHASTTSFVTGINGGSGSFTPTTKYLNTSYTAGTAVTSGTTKYIHFSAGSVPTKKSQSIVTGFSTEASMNFNTGTSTDAAYVSSISNTAASGTPTTRYLHPTTTSVVTSIDTNSVNVSKSTHTHSVTAAGTVDLGSNTTSTDGVTYVESLTKGGYTPAGSVTLNANNFTTTSAITGVTSDGTTDVVTGITAGSMIGSRSTSGSGSSARRTLSISYTSASASGSTNVWKKAKASGSTNAFTGISSTKPSFSGTQSNDVVTGGTTKYFHPSFTGSAVTAVASTATESVLNSVTVDGTTNAITALSANTSSATGDITYLQSYSVSGGTTTPTTKYMKFTKPVLSTTNIDIIDSVGSAPSLTVNTTASGGEAVITALSTGSVGGSVGLTNTGSTGIQYIESATHTHTGASVSGSSNAITSLAANTTAATGDITYLESATHTHTGASVATTGSAVTGVTSGSVTKTTKYMELENTNTGS